MSTAVEESVSPCVLHRRTPTDARFSVGCLPEIAQPDTAVAGRHLTQRRS